LVCKHYLASLQYPPATHCHSYFCVAADGFGGDDDDDDDEEEEVLPLHLRGHLIKVGQPVCMYAGSLLSYKYHCPCLLP
jgi:hypothetical protein